MPLNPKQTKKLNQQLKKIEQYFTKLDDKTKTAIYNSKDFKEFLENTKDFTTGNILVTDGVANEVSNAVILANNLNQLKQRELVKNTIEEACFNLVSDVGNQIKNDLREMAQKGYDLGLGRRELAKRITERDLEALYIFRGSKEESISESKWNRLSPEEKAKYTFNSNIAVMSPKTRVQTIARTETKRAETIVNYIRAQERGQNKFKVTCRSDCCPLCAEIYQDLQDYEPTEKKETILNDGVEYDMEADIDKLPPFHPNCLCSAEFYKGEEVEQKPIINQLADYDEILHSYGFKAGKPMLDDNDFISQTFTKKHENGQETTLYINEDVINNNGFKQVKLNEVVEQIGKADLKYTTEITLSNFKDPRIRDIATGTNFGIRPKPGEKSSNPDPEHKIFFNPKIFNEKKYSENDNVQMHWKHTIHHEIMHSADITKNNFNNTEDGIGRSGKSDFRKMEMDSLPFTRYSLTNPAECFAEHGGYIKNMLANPELQDKYITIAGDEKINFKEYKKKYPEFYNYFKGL